MTEPRDRVGDLLTGDDRALAKIITHLENRHPGYREIVKDLHPHTGRAHILGVTGPPGAGKSTLVGRMIKRYLEDGRTVGVIAFDPSSPYSGGSILGDRTRLRSDSLGPEVFFRSMSTRGIPGGLSATTGDVVRALDASGKDVIIVETVGSGQSEVEIMNIAHTVLLVVTPGIGDGIQFLKAGILEIADIYVLNMSDRTGSDRTAMELREMIRINNAVGDQTDRDRSWDPPIVETVATEGTNVDKLMERVREHVAHLERDGRIEGRELRRYRWEIRSLLMGELRRQAEQTIESLGGIDSLAQTVAERETDPYSVIQNILDPASP